MSVKFRHDVNKRDSPGGLIRNFAVGRRFVSGPSVKGTISIGMGKGLWRGAPSSAGDMRSFGEGREEREERRLR
jgi:hypothetical protein